MKRERRKNKARKGAVWVLAAFALSILTAFYLVGYSETSHAATAGTIGPWNSTTTFPSRVEDHAAVAFEGHIYVLGGYGGPGTPYAHNDVTFTQVNTDGTLQPWESTTPFTTGRYLHAVAIDRDNRRIYISGGWDSNQNKLNDVQYATIFSNGYIGAWQTTTPLPRNRYGHSSVAYNGYLYVIAGADAGEYNDVYFARINSDGSLGEWEINFWALLNGGRRYHTTVVYNGNFYVTGGFQGYEALGDVQYAPAKPAPTYTGDFTAQWKTTTYLPTTRDLHTSVASNEFLYVLGGKNCNYDDFSGSLLSDVLYARINSDGSVSPWFSTTSLPNVLKSHASVVYNKYIYTIGGWSGSCSRGSSTDAVLYTQINMEDTTPPKTNFSHPAGPYTAPFSVTLTCEDGLGSGCDKTYYTTDGSNPTTASTVYSTPIPINTSITLKFFSTDLDGNFEEFTHLEYTIDVPPENYADGFVYPVGGEEDQYGLCPNDIRATSCYWLCQDFLEEVDDNCIYIGVGTHLGEDWNRGSGYDDYGDTVFAIADGEVVFHEPDVSRWGEVLIIRHNLSDGTQVESLYGHLSKSIVDDGDTVYLGQKIGEIGDGGRYVTNPASHLHFEIRYPNNPYWGEPGPGYSTASTGWTDPSEFIDANLAETWDINRVSIGNDGIQGDNDSYSPAISPNGQYVAFRTLASNITMTASGGYYIYDRQTSSINAINYDATGTSGNGSDFNTSFSADGRYKVFASDASNLVSGDTNGVSDIFVYDQQTGVTSRVSVDSSGNQSNGMSYDAGISADGRYVVFTSNASNLVADDTNWAKDVFLHDRQTGETRRISVDSSGTQANGDSYQPSISANGQYVAFVSEATNLLAGDTNGLADIFIADIQSGDIWRISVDNSGNQSNGVSYHPSISSEGRHIAFESNASNLVSGDTNGYTDIFIYDRLNSTVQRISISENGEEADGPSYEPRISSYGMSVAFISKASNLVSGDTNGKADVFVSFLSSLATSNTNNPPSAAELVSPSNGQQGLPTTVTFKWKPSTDPDGDTVTYDLYYCKNQDYSACSPVEVVSLDNSKDTYYAGIGYGVGILLFGIALASGVSHRRRITLLIGMIIVTGMLLVSCGSGNGGNSNGGGDTADDEVSYTVSGLNPDTIYYWKVVAKDGNGEETESDIYSFTTAP